ncbi:Fc.00g044400.m01.CDS01 [Cosmosporella sp. VM-42]
MSESNQTNVQRRVQQFENETSTARLHRSYDDSEAEKVARSLGRTLSTSPRTKRRGLLNLAQVPRSQQEQPGLHLGPSDESDVADDDTASAPSYTFEPPSPKIPKHPLSRSAGFSDNEVHSGLDEVEVSEGSDEKVDVLAGKLQQQQEAWEATKHDVDKTKQTIEDLHGRVSELENEREQLLWARKFDKEQMERMQRKIEDLKVTLDRHEKMKERLVKKLERRERRIEELEQRLEDARQEIEAEDEQRRQMDRDHQEELHQARLASDRERFAERERSAQAETLALQRRSYGWEEYHPNYHISVDSGSLRPFTPTIAESSLPRSVPSQRETQRQACSKKKDPKLSRSRKGKGKGNLLETRRDASHNDRTVHIANPYAPAQQPLAHRFSPLALQVAIAAMTRAQQTISLALLVSSLYLALFFELIPLSPLIQEQIVPVLPFWAIVSFGAFLLFRLGWGVFTFNDVPAAHKELMGEIEQAKVDLRKLGVDVD